jgi:hypothetical protein
MGNAVFAFFLNLVWFFFDLIVCSSFNEFRAEFVRGQKAVTAVTRRKMLTGDPQESSHVASSSIRLHRCYSRGEARTVVLQCIVESPLADVSLSLVPGRSLA